MASEKLVIVESPTKARTIGKMLGSEYRIMASMGHIRDLPEHSFGVDIEHDFAPQYVETPRSAKTIRELKSLAKSADHIYLAPDPDREGEAIAWHLRELLEKSTKAPFHRVTFHEITKSAINKAFQATSEIDMALVDAQQARRVLDRLVGYMISPLLWSRIEKGISAGRVQSVALRMICDREREIQAFTPEEYWNFNAEFEALGKGSGHLYNAKLFKIDSEKFKAQSKEDSDRIVSAVRGSSSGFKISFVETKPKNRYAPPPFITSSLQQTASNLLGFSATFTMQIAQQLYEGIELGSGSATGLITYMRTDSVNIANEAREACRDFISANIGPDYVPEKPNFFKSKSSAQEAHEAIRPTDINLTPEKVAKFLSPQQLKLYSLIWKRFAACQMAPAEIKQTTVDTDTLGSDNRLYTFRTTASVTSFPGFLKVYQGEEEEGKDESKCPPFLAELKPSNISFLKALKTEQKFTEPPPRYSEATLIKELETNGIGRPSTYATIINTILKRLYVSREKGKLIPSELGFKVSDFLMKSLPDLFQTGFTAEMETRLDKVEEGNLQWTQMLKDFYKDFDVWIKQAKHADSPEQEKPKMLVTLLDQITDWEEPRKVGKRVYNDKKFFTSVRDKFNEGAHMTANQWQALLNLAAKYKDKIPTLMKDAAECGFAEELDCAIKKNSDNAERIKNSTASDADVSKYGKIFSYFDNVKWEAPRKSGARSYDDGKFFESLKTQALSGKILSEKQVAALGKIAGRYKDQIAGFAELAPQLGINPDEVSENPASGDNASAASANPRTAELVEALSKFDKWDAPVSKGRRTYDDKSFFESLKKQHESGKTLSDKQMAALTKLHSKYFSPKE